MDKNKAALFFLVFLVLVAGLSVTLLLQKRSSVSQPTVPVVKPTSPPLVPPTLTEERKEIIRKMENHVVTIQNGQFNPANLTIKLHDQVEWRNETNETYQIKGEGWGNVPIGPQRRFAKEFAQPGIFPYSCALHPEVTGTVIVE